jgi:hypothetical protein
MEGVHNRSRLGRSARAGLGPTPYAFIHSRGERIGVMLATIEPRTYVFASAV